MAQTTERLKTTGMHCQSCAMLIEMNVGEMKGVSEVSVDLAESSTRVTFDDSVVGVDAIIAEIEKSGYGVERAS